MTRYNWIVFPRGFTVTVNADDIEEAKKAAHDYVMQNCTVTLVRNDDSYDPENLLDEFELMDPYEVEHV